MSQGLPNEASDLQTSLWIGSLCLSAERIPLHPGLYLHLPPTGNHAGCVLHFRFHLQGPGPAPSCSSHWCVASCLESPIVSSCLVVAVPDDLAVHAGVAAARPVLSGEFPAPGLAPKWRTEESIA